MGRGGLDGLGLLRSGRRILAIGSIRNYSIALCILSAICRGTGLSLGLGPSSSSVLRSLAVVLVSDYFVQGRALGFWLIVGTGGGGRVLERTLGRRYRGRRGRHVFFCSCICCRVETRTQIALSSYAKEIGREAVKVSCLIYSCPVFNWIDYIHQESPKKTCWCWRSAGRGFWCWCRSVGLEGGSGVLWRTGGWRSAECWMAERRDAGDEAERRQRCV